jgi:hypothetical protein
MIKLYADDTFGKISHREYARVTYNNKATHCAVINYFIFRFLWKISRTHFLNISFRSKQVRRLFLDFIIFSNKFLE